ncbi:hypothetical protein B0H14DRAFT_3895977 [Mycena olivaceomarginata]|nr:hypothetical protein B0H14DRAFT_3895977 [Mycena olivaceomarginata]
MAGLGFATLPLELQRTIFEIAALSRPAEMLSQMRVAWRVKHWVEPFLYRVILISPLSDTECIQRAEGFPSIRIKPTPRKNPHQRRAVLPPIRHPYFLRTLARATAKNRPRGLPARQDAILRPTHHNPEYLPILNRLECLRRLTLDDALFGDAPLDFSQPLFRHLTHLEILDSYDDGDDMGNANIGGASARAWSRISHTSPSTPPWPPRRCTRRPAHTPAWNASCFSSPTRTARRTLLPARHPDSDDDRFVLVQQRNFRRGWFRGAAGRRDYWELAEEFLAARRAGTIARSQYCTFDPEDPGWI